MATTSSSTLRKYLTQRNPHIVLLNNGAVEEPARRPSGRSYTTHYDYPLPYKVIKWKDFNMRNIKKIFEGEVGEMLKQEFDDFQSITDSLTKDHRICDEPSLQIVIGPSIATATQAALEKTSPLMISQQVQMGVGRIARFFHKSRKVPDWAATSDLQNPNNICPGDTKLSKNFKSQDMYSRSGVLIRSVDNMMAPALWPLRQITYYCLKSHARYGYLITESELIVVRVSHHGELSENANLSEISQAVHDRALVEWEAIPWNHEEDSKDLTVTLALWVLHILAANDGHLGRKYQSLKEEKVRPLAQHRVLSQEPTSPISETEDATESESCAETSLDVGDVALASSQQASPTMSSDSPPPSPRSRRNLKRGRNGADSAGRGSSRRRL
jgi:hypothetical protein